MPREYEAALRGQTIDEDHPGTILRDFGTLLDYIGSEGIAIGAGDQGFFPNRIIRDLDSRMARPMAHALKRPTQATFPHLNGLYLLLRSSGLGVIEGKGKQRRIARDEALLEIWRSLNLVERYFALLEAWLILGHPNIIGERSRAWDGHLYACTDFVFQGMRTGSLHIGEKGQNLDQIRHGPGFYNLALMDLFGLVTVKQGTPRPGTGWCIRTVKRTAFGQALLFIISPMWIGFALRMAELAKKAAKSGDGGIGKPEKLNHVEPSSADIDPPGLLDQCEDGPEQWQRRLRSFFPEWRNRLPRREVPFRDGRYVLKVSLGDVWRRIAMAGSMDLEYLCGAILEAFDFDYDHLYAFYYKDRLGITREVVAPMMDDEPTTEEVQIGKMDLEPGDSFQFHYDFGDDWRFEVQLEQVEPADVSLKRPELIESHGKAPQQYLNWDEEYEEEDDNSEEDDEDDLDEEDEEDDGGPDEPRDVPEGDRATNGNQRRSRYR